MDMRMDTTQSTLLRNTLTLILAGGQGERLYPLTKDRSKPSVPFAGSFRIIDFTLSNCINSGLRHIFVLSQYKSQSLNRHIREGWSLLHRDLGEFIETVPPQHRTHSRWYEGTADAIYQNVYLLEQMRPERVLILSGDHIYRMNYGDMIDFHVRKNADVTISSFEYPRQDSSPFGVMQVNEDDQILDFVEKPADPPPIPGKPDRSLVNMGVYVFNTPTLVRAVIEDAKSANTKYDIGKNIIPRLIEQEKTRIFSYQFTQQDPHPYWRDVGSIHSYYQASMALLDGHAPINLFSDAWPFRTDSFSLPPSVFHVSSFKAGQIQESMVANGCVIEGELVRCIISPEVRVGEGSHLEGCIVFNRTRIGKNCKIQNTIVDKHVSIPDNTVIGYDAESDRKQFLVSDGQITLIPKNMEVV